MAYERVDEVLEYGCVTSTGVTINSQNTLTNVPNFSSQTFVKRRSDTDVWIQISASAWANNTGSICQWGVNVSGTDYLMSGIQYFNFTGDHRYYQVANRILFGAAAGSYSVMGRWKWHAGSMNMDSYDHFSIVLKEIVSGL